MEGAEERQPLIPSGSLIGDMIKAMPSTLRLHSVLLIIGAFLGASACAYRQGAGMPPPPGVPVVVTSEDRNLGIPNGQLPPPGECRIWFPGRPPGQQPPPGPCGRGAIPAGAWLLSRPGDSRLVRVQEYDAARAGVIAAVKIYEAATGRFLRRE